MTKRKPKYRNPLRTREAVPKVNRTDSGVQLMCPFCKPSHPLVPGQPTPCGTTLRVTAVQQIVAARVVRHQNLVCLKCKEGGGEMVKFMNGFVHVEECNPGVNLLSEVPPDSKAARLVYKFPKPIRFAIEKLAGTIKTVKEIDPEGNETGNIVSYFFMKRMKV